MLTDNELPCQKIENYPTQWCSSASWSTNGSAADKIQVQVQAPQENEVEQIYFRDSQADKKSSELIGVKSDSSCQTPLHWLILSLFSLACQASDNIFNIKLAENKWLLI